MFNGIILKKGKIKKISKGKQGINIYIYSNLKFSKKDVGMSISCDGVCLTLVDINKKLLEFYLSNETIKRTKFRKTKIDDPINIETPLKFGKGISGHIIQGHVDCVGIISSIRKFGKSYLFDFIINTRERKNIIEKASVAVNGISLTISKKTKKGFKAWVIPHTLKLTNLLYVKRNDLVNIEIDILSKYVRNYFYEK